MQVVTHNLLAQFTDRQLNINNKNKDKSTERLSSGYRINRAADDAAGLQISEKMRWQIRGLNKASNNIQDGGALLQVADGALSEVHDMLHRLNELVIQAANDTNTAGDRQDIQKEINALIEEIERIGTDTTFNTMPVFNGGNVQIADNVNDLTLSLPLGTDVAINSSNIDILLNKNADGSYELQDGHNYTIDSNITNTTFHIGNGATVTVKNSNLKEVGFVCDNSTLYMSNVSVINSFDDSSTTYPRGYKGAPITCKGNTTINYLGSNKLQGGRHIDTVSSFEDYAGIQVDNGNNLTLNGNGTLNVTGSVLSAGIGSSYFSGRDNHILSGNITIHSGYINASSQENGAGIGGCYEGVNGRIMIDGGSIHAQSKSGGAGIGTGSIVFGTRLQGETVTVNGGYIEAIGGSTDGGAGIGGGFCANGVNVTISDGTVIAKGSSGGAGIGSGRYSDQYPLVSGNVVITGGDVTASGSTWKSPYGVPGYEHASAIGQGSLEALLPSYEQDWMNGFGTLIIDGITKDMYTEGRDSKDGDNYRFSYKGATSSPAPVQPDEENKLWWIQMGATSGNGIFISTGKISPKDLEIDNIDVSSYGSSGAAMTNVQKAIDKVSDIRSHIGAQYNRLEHGLAIDDNSAENTQSAESRIRDAEMAEEMVNYAKHSILQQAGQSMLTQANQIPNGIIQLLS